MQRQTEKGRTRPLQFSPEAVEVLEDHHWPGNVRELENLVQRACVLASGNVLFPSDLPFDSKKSMDEDVRSKLERSARRCINAGTENGSTPVEIAMRELVRAALLQTEANEKAAAKLLGVTATELKNHLPTAKKKS